MDKKEITDEQEPVTEGSAEDCHERHIKATVTNREKNADLFYIHISTESFVPAICLEWKSR